MKVRNKLVIIITFLLVLAVVSTYIFVPSELNIVNTELVHCNAGGASRVINEDSNWRKWQYEDGVEGETFRVAGKFYRETVVNIERAGIMIPGKITILHLRNVDSIALRWRCSFASSFNPLKRVIQYREAVRIKKKMHFILNEIRGFLEKKENVYGMDVEESISRDSTLVVTKWVSASYPSTVDIYKQIHAIRDYVARQGAREINYPMLNVKQLQNGQFEPMVAIPVNKDLAGNGKLYPKRYVPWKILAGTVKGGDYTAEKALVQIRQYVADYERVPMGLPYQSLVTERDHEPDSSQWITRVVQAVP